MEGMRRFLALPALAALGLTLALAREPRSTPVRVRFAEGMAHGFLELHDGGGALLASGDLYQVPRGDVIESRMVFHFRDSSRMEETVRFSQHGIFRVHSYHLIQQGPAFETDVDESLDASTGAYRVVTHDRHSGHDKQWQGSLAMPDDIANGLVTTIAKNIGAHDTAIVHIVAFTPKPRVIELQLSPAAAQHVLNGERSEGVEVFDVKPKIGGVIGVIAKVAGKVPPDSHIWIVNDQVPAFVRFEGPMYIGPVWRLDLTSPHWPHQTSGP